MVSVTGREVEGTPFRVHLSLIGARRGHRLGSRKWWEPSRPCWVGESRMNLFVTDYANLEDTFRSLAEEDGTIYLPNPSPAGPVDFIFIAMEPSMGRWAGASNENARSWVSQGFRNFLLSIDDFCFHYSVRKFLCGPGQSYHVTDISKGPMLVGKAGQNRRARWDKWYPSFVAEIKLVAKPSAKILTLGEKAAALLERKGFQNLDGTILHFSTNAVRWRKRAVEGREAEFKSFAASVAIRDVIIVAEAAMAEAQFPEVMRRQILNGLPTALSESQKQLMFTYKIAFEPLKSLGTP